MRETSTHLVSYEELIAFAEGSYVAAIAEHIAECSECAETVALYQSVRATIQDDDSVLPDDATIARAEAIYVLDPAPAHPNAMQQAWTWLAGARNRFSLGPAFVAVAAALVLFFAGAQALAPAVQSTLPGDALYPVKTTIEGIQLAVSIDDTSKIQAELAIAHMRVQELDGAIAQQRYSLIPQITLDYESRIQHVTSTLDQAVKQDPSTQAPLARQAAKDLSQYNQTLSVLKDVSPAGVVPDIAHALAVSSAAQSNVQSQLVNIGIAPAPSVTPSPTQPAATATGTTTPMPTGTPTDTPTSIPSATSLPSATAVPALTGTSTVTPTIVPASGSSTIEPPATATGTMSPTPTTIQQTPTSTPELPTNTPQPPETSAPPAATAVPPSPAASPVATNTPTPSLTATQEPPSTKTPRWTRTPAATATPNMAAGTSPTATATPHDRDDRHIVPLARNDSGQGGSPVNPKQRSNESQNGTGQCGGGTVTCSSYWLPALFSSLFVLAWFAIVQVIVRRPRLRISTTTQAR